MLYDFSQKIYQQSINAHIFFFKIYSDLIKDYAVNIQAFINQFLLFLISVLKADRIGLYLIKKQELVVLFEKKALRNRSDLEKDVSLNLILRHRGEVLVRPTSNPFYDIFIINKKRGWNTLVLGIGDSSQKRQFTRPEKQLIGLASHFLFSLYKEKVAHELIKVAAQKDPLLKIWNRNSLDKYLKKEKRKHVVVMIDIDHFKKINDVYGHKVGDRILMQMAHIFTDSLRQSDFLARYGGEEFCVVMPGTITDVRAVINKIRIKVAKFKFTKNIRATISAGIGKNISQADRALYRAKDAGRNKVVLYKK
jgi:diguanylate cyclase (GGDEF)-like protein